MALTSPGPCVPWPLQGSGKIRSIAADLGPDLLHVQPTNATLRTQRRARHEATASSGRGGICDGTALVARRLVLLRHGRIAANRDGLWHGSTDSELLPQGQRQARRTARFLVQREPEFAAVYSSPLQRCQDTAAAFVDLWNRNAEREARRAAVADWFRQRLGALAPSSQEGLPPQPLSITTLHDLREYSIGDWEGMSFADLAREHQFIERSCEDLDYAAPGGESLRQVSERYRQALLQIDARHADTEDVLVVGHGAAFAVALATLINDAPDKWRDYGIDNCGLSELTLGPWPELLSLNHTAHL